MLDTDRYILQQGGTCQDHEDGVYFSDHDPVYAEALPD